MLVEALLEFPIWLISLIPEVTIEIPAAYFNGIYTITNNLGYIFPFTKLIPILLISFSIKGLQIIWAIVIRVKSFIPTMGA